jgi:tetratricopeptide (TPR) repeat protein
MGQYDSIIKFLGKEDAYPADQIEKGLDTLDVDYESAGDIPDDNLANVDNLLNMFGGSSPSAASGEEVSVRDMGGENETGGLGEDEGSPAEPVSRGESSNDGFGGNQGAIFDIGDIEGIDESVLKEMENLDSPPPEISDLEKKWADRARQEAEKHEQPEGLENLPGLEMPENDMSMDFEVEGSRPMSEIPLQEEGENAGNSFDETKSTAGADTDFGDFLRDMREGENGAETPVNPIGTSDGDKTQTMGFEDFLKPDEYSTKTNLPGQDNDQRALQEILDSSVEGGGEPSGGEGTGETAFPDMQFDTGETPESGSSADVFGDLDNFANAGMESFGETSSPGEGFGSEPAGEPSLPGEDFDMSAHELSFSSSAFIPESSGTPELDQDRVLKIRTRINQMRDKNLRRKLRQAIIDGVLPQDATDRLVMMVLLGESDEAISNFLEGYADRIRVPEEKAVRPEAAATPKARRQVIYSDTIRKTEQSRKEAEKFMQMSALVFFAVVLLGFISWRVIFVPMASDRQYEAGIRAIQNEEYTLSEEKFLAGKQISGPQTHWYNRFADEYTKKKKFDLARKKYEEALDFRPLDRETLFNYGDFYKMIYPRQYDKAVELYNRVASRDKNDFDAQDKVGLAYIDWAKETADPDKKKEHLRDAYDVYANYIFKHEKHVGSYFRLLDIALMTRDEKQVDNLYGRIDFLNKKAINVKTMTELAKFYTDLKRYDQSKAVFDKLMSVDPMYDEAFYEYARYLAINTDYIKAMKALRYALKYNDKNGKAWNLMGEIFFIDESNPDHLESAIKAFENARNFTPDYYKPYINIGHIYFYRDLNEYIGTGSEKVDSQASERNQAQAFEYYKTARALIPKDMTDFDLSYNLSWLYYKNGQYQDAFNELAELYVDSPYNPAVIYAIANAYFHLGNYKLAKLQYDKAIEYYQAIADKVAYINPDLERHQEIYSQLARCYNNRGVVYSRWAKMSPRSVSVDMSQKALLDFYLAKNTANRIGVQPYNYAEVNIRTALDRGVRGREPMLDEFIPKRTTLRKFSEEFKQRVLENL